MTSTEWRKKKGLSLAAVAASTKICQRYLEAIELGRFKSLPAGVYATSYIRQYARAIDFEEDELLDCYRSAVAPEEPRPETHDGPESWIGRVWGRLGFC
jgi:cytoskeleton protein RodZ